MKPSNIMPEGANMDHPPREDGWYIYHNPVNGPNGSSTGFFCLYSYAAKMNGAHRAVQFMIDLGTGCLFVRSGATGSSAWTMWREVSDQTHMQVVEDQIASINDFIDTHLANNPTSVYRWQYQRAVWQVMPRNEYEHGTWQKHIDDAQMTAGRKRRMRFYILESNVIRRSHGLTKRFENEVLGATQDQKDHIWKVAPTIRL